MSPLDSWQISIPFWYKASLCRIEIGNFRTQFWAELSAARLLNTIKDEDDLKNEDDLMNKDDLKYEDDLKNEKNLDNEENLQNGDI